MTTAPRTVLLVGTGAISVAFLPGLVSVLTEHLAYRVRVVLTATACRLVSAESLSALTGEPVGGPGWPTDASGGAEHTRLADWAEVMVVWPASLSFLTRCAYGSSSDLASATVLAAKGPVVVAPSLAEGVAAKAVYRRAVDLLAASGMTILGPIAGPEVGSRRSSDGACVDIGTLTSAIARTGPPRTERHPSPQSVDQEVAR